VAEQSAANNLAGFNAGYLTPNMAQPYFERAARASVAMRLGVQVPVGIEGEAVPVVTGRAEAYWTAEAGRKKSTSTGLGLKSITPKKLTAISVVSSEVVRRNPGNYMTVLRNQIGDAFAYSFDLAAFHGTDMQGGPAPFGTGMFLDATTKQVELGSETVANGGIWRDLVDAMQLVVADTSAVSGGPSTMRRRVNGWALDAIIEPTFLGSFDTAGRPLFLDTPITDTASPIRQSTLLGRPAMIGEGVAPDTDLTSVVGYGGDFSQLVWGVTSGISFSVSNQATVTIGGVLTSLWENNLLAIKAEAEYGLLINDIKSFVRLANRTGS
jgi:HK97 family phage major capsid protein